MKKILITGANGLLGQKLVKLIAEKEAYTLMATSRGKCRLPKGNYTFTSLDVTSPDEIQKIISQYQPDYLIHTAAMTQVDACEQRSADCWQQNVKAVTYLTEACKQYNVFFLHLSTDFIFDGEAGPYDEAATPAPISHYGESKLASEQIVKESGLPWAIVRTVLVYGIVPDMSRSNIILWVKKSLEENKTIKVVNDQWRTPTLAEDLALGCYLIIERNAQGVFNIAGKDFLTPYEMALKTAQCFALDATPIQKADASTFKQPAKRPPKTGFIIDKAIKQLGYQPHSFEEGLNLMKAQIASLEASLSLK